MLKYILLIIGLPILIYANWPSVVETLFPLNLILILPSSIMVGTGGALIAIGRKYKA